MKSPRAVAKWMGQEHSQDCCSQAGCVSLVPLLALVMLNNLWQEFGVSFVMMFYFPLVFVLFFPLLVCFCPQDGR